MPKQLDRDELADKLGQHIDSRAGEFMPQPILLNVIEAAGATVNGYVWCKRGNTRVRCKVPAHWNLSDATGGTEHVILALPTNDNQPGGGEYVGLQQVMNGVTNSRLPRLRADTFEIQDAGGTVQTQIQADGDVIIGSATQQTNATPLQVEGGLTFKEIAANPTADTGYGKIWTKSDNVLYFQDGAGTDNAITFSGGSVAHNSLSELTTGDVHTHYALLAGRSGGQTLIGGTDSGDDLTLQSTIHATKGSIIFGSASAYDEVNDRLGLGNLSPDAKLDVAGNVIQNWTSTTPAAVTNGYAFTGTIAAGATSISQAHRGFLFDSTITGTGGGNATVSGIRGSVFDNQTSGTQGSIQGGQFNVFNINAGTIIIGTALSAALGVTGTGNITTGVGVSVNAPIKSSSGVIVTSIGVNIANQGMVGGTAAIGINVGNQSGSTTNFAIKTSAGNVVFNEGGDAGTDFRVEGDTSTHLLFADAGNDNVTINGASVSANYDLGLVGDGVLMLKEGSAPTADAGYGKIWTETNNELFFQSGDGQTHLLHGNAFSEIWFHDASTVEVSIATQNAMTQIDSFTVVGHEDDLLNVVGSTATNDLTLSSIAGGEYEVAYHASITATGGADKEMMLAWGITLATPKDITDVTDDTITPIVITSTAHGLEDGDMVEIVGVLGNTAANGSFIVDSKTDNTFEIVGLDGGATTGNGNFDAGSPTGDVTIEYPGNMVIHKEVRGATLGHVAASGLHIIADSDVLGLYVANLDGTTNLTIAAISFDAFRVGD